MKGLCNDKIPENPAKLRIMMFFLHSREYLEIKTKK